MLLKFIAWCIMQKKIEIEVVETTSKVVLNYHKHPEVGGTGHVSIEATCDGKKYVISVYPSTDLSPLTPLAVTSMYIFPTKAVNHSSPSHTDSPIHASYDLTDEIADINAVIEEMSKLHEVMDSGRASFSLTPGCVTKTAAAILNCNASTTNMMLGLKMYDRSLIDSEIAQVEVINCAEAVSRILEAGGIKRPEGILSFAAPSSINSHFASRFKETEGTDTATEQSPEPSETVPEQSQPSPTAEEPGFLRGIYNSFVSFFTPKETYSSTEPTKQSSNSYDYDWPSYDSSPSEESAKVETQVETPSRDEVTPSPASRDEDTSSRASECSESFFSSEQVTAQREEESDLDYCSRYDAMVN